MYFLAKTVLLLQQKNNVEECWRIGKKNELFFLIDLGCAIYSTSLQGLHTLFWHFGVIITVKLSQVHLISTGN